MKRAHVVQTVSELDEQDAHVLGDGDQQLAQVFSLLRLLGDEVEALKLGQPLDQLAHLGAEQLVDLLTGSRRVLDRIVQERDRDRRLIEMHVGEDRRHLERV